MQKIDVLVTTCILSVSIHALNATAAQNNIVVGANVYDEGVLSPAGQDAEIERMAHSGVKTIRTGFSDKSLYFITQAFQHGIGTVGVVYPAPKAWDGKLGVSLPDTIAFLRHNGLDSLADGYGVHVYPTGNPQDASAIYRCGALTEAGKLALSPM